MSSQDMNMLDELYSDPEFLAYIKEEEEKAMEIMMADFATQNA